MDSAHQAVVTDMLFDWLETNYNYSPKPGWSYDEVGEQFNFSNGRSLERWQIVLLRDRQTPDEMREHLLANLPEEWDANMIHELYDFVSQNP